MTRRRQAWHPTQTGGWADVDRKTRKIRMNLRLMAFASLVGIVAGLGAIAFVVLSQFVWHVALGTIVGFHPPHPSGETELFGPSQGPFKPWLLIAMPGIGGVLSGLLVYLFAPEAAGHGTDSAIESYHYKDGYIRPQVPPVKLVASAITIGTGGSGGREGPIAQIGAGFGSFLGRLLRLAPAEQRVLMAAGMGAGIGAIFRAPLAGAVFAAEVLYRDPDFESEVLMPAGIASVIAYSVVAIPFGFQSLFDTPECRFESVLELGPYFLLAAAMAFLAMVYTRFFYYVADRFEAWNVHPVLKTALGGLLTGLVGVAIWFPFRDTPDATHVLSVVSYGYGILHSFLEDPTLRHSAGWLPVAALLAVAFGKILTTTLTIGSGGSGGIFGPSMVIGGCSGAAIGMALRHWAPSLVPEPATYMILGMAGFFAAAAKTPFSTLLMVSEITGNFQLVTPALWVCVISYLLSSDDTMYRSQLENRFDSPWRREHFPDARRDESLVPPAR